jgi:uncharacterized protein YqgC (DUF456 family)
MILTGIVFYGIFIGIVGLYIATGLWLDHHGGARRWHLWAMSVVACAALAADIALAGTGNVQLIGLGAGFGAIVGAVVGLFVKVPRLSKQQHQESRPRPRV